MGDKMISPIFAQCESCGQNFYVSTSDIKRKTIQTMGKPDFVLTFYKCIVCGKVHFVQIDNTETTQMLYDITMQMRYLVSLRNNEETATAKEIKDRDNTLKRMRIHLEQTRENLMRQYNNISVCIDGKFINLVFSV